MRETVFISEETSAQSVGGLHGGALVHNPSGARCPLPPSGPIRDLNLVAAYRASRYRSVSLERDLNQRAYQNNSIQ